MCLWDVNDGRCIEFTKLACTHTGIQVSIYFCNCPNQHSSLQIHNLKKCVLNIASIFLMRNGYR